MPRSSPSFVTGGRLLAAVIGIPLAIAAAADGGFTLVGLYAHASEHHQASYQLAGGAITLQTSSGSISVVTGGGNEVEVSYTEHYQLKKPAITSTTTGGGVQLIAKCPGGLFGDNCEINYVLTVPAAARLTLHSGNGSVTSNGTTGAQSFDTDNGSIELTGVGGTVTARSGNGSIHGKALRSTSFQATSGNGEIGLGWTSAPDSVDATSGNGGIDIVVPAGSGPYQVSATTGNGQSHLSVPNDTAAASSLSARTGNGGVTIGYPSG